MYYNEYNSNRAFKLLKQDEEIGRVNEKWWANLKQLENRILKLGVNHDKLHALAFPKDGSDGDYQKHQKLRKPLVLIGVGVISGSLPAGRPAGQGMTSTR